MNLKQFTAMFKARSMEFVRDRGSFLWNLLFPVLMVAAFAIAFSGSGDQIFKVGVIGPQDTSNSFFRMEQIQFVAYTPDQQDRALAKLRQHQIELVVDTRTHQFWTNGQSAKSRLVKKLFVADNSAYTEQAVTGKAVRYVDWVVPGVLGMNIMFSCLFGVGYVIVRYRKNGVLKRLKATPVSALNFVSAQAASRLTITFLTCVVVFAGTNLFLGFTMNGSWIDLVAVTLLGILCMISLGLVFASRLKNEELVNGLMNLVTFPMMLLSGLFFTLEGAPDVVQNLAWIFPLTPFIDACRKIMLEGAPLVQVLPQVTELGLMTAGFLALSAWLFKWE